MTNGFRRGAKGAVLIDLTADEAAVLRSMAALVLELVEEPEEQDEFATMVGIGTSSEPHEDPVLARLFPDAYGDDAKAASDFRRYTEDELRRHKRENAQTMLESIPAEVPRTGCRVELDLADAHAWLKGLNDVRLALGTRLGVSEETDQDVDALLSGARGVDHPDAAALHIFGWLGGVQESLVLAIQGE
ncbi:uncharacterized protein DUF2017 [Murinocardiopsis flavida]|uniref:Uncharacterized protein DUF2017 n=1 Tax=Murinocardiopsis flavida TaxID=645275 RepID=A0A2P8CMT6_9ACTN|nr:DUF2017 domain-containing protein [Murinocardiopsis flavida]PSK86282.1 uncharacterized protein DUF2017 [Murinocardiopsis flavida]